MDSGHSLSRASSSQSLNPGSVRLNCCAIVLAFFACGFGQSGLVWGDDRVEFHLLNWTDEQPAKSKLIPTSLLAEEGRDANPQSDRLPTPIAANQTSESVPTDSASKSEPGNIGIRLLTTVPASKMIIRRDPSKTRGLPGSEDTPGKSLREIQLELQQGDQTNELGTIPPMIAPDTGWSVDEPYGRYLYIHHGPLIYEDIPAERYGEFYCEQYGDYVQPFVSFTKFMGTTALLPYKLTTNYYAAYHEDGLYSFDHQGNLRPGILEGSFLPSWDVIRQYPRSNFVGAATEAATVTGLIFVFP